MLRKLSKPITSNAGPDSKSSLFTINRLLHSKLGGNYKSLFATAGESSAVKRRHTIGDVNTLGAAASRRRSISKGVITFEERLAEAEKLAAATKKEEKVPEEHDTDAISCQLALKHRLMVSEVKGIIKEFLKGSRNEQGGMDQAEFDKVMARIFDVPAINKTVSQSAYTAAGVWKEINIEKFLVWYVQNMFTSINALTADQAMAACNSLAYNMAAKYKVSNFAIDKIKSKFDHYDLDRSGKINYSEFQAMFCSILNASISDLNPIRIKGFWAQADRNQDNGIDFEEFVDWYLKYFKPDNENDEWDMSGPLRKYYDSFNPTVQRRSQFEARASRAHSL